MINSCRVFLVFSYKTYFLILKLRCVPILPQKIPVKNATAAKFCSMQYTPNVSNAKKGLFVKL